MYKLIQKREYSHINKIQLNYIFEKQCVNELKQNKLDLFYKLLETKLYQIIILIDGREDTIIENLCHNVQILFINNIQHKSCILQTLLLVDIDLENYYFMTSNGSILDWNKTIKRNQSGIKYNEIQLDSYLLLENINFNEVKYIYKLTKSINKFIRNIGEIIATYILIFCYMFYQFYLLLVNLYFI
jgi:hypothetical protein